MTRIWIPAVLLMAGTAAVAQTAPKATAPAAPAARHDKMHDRTMTRADVVAMVREHFTKMDANKDGSISKDELARLHDMHAPMAHRGDPSAAFDRLDSNKDGMISRDEFAKGHEMRIERRIVMREKASEKAEGAEPGPAMRAMRAHGGHRARMIVMADTNKDGRITLAEAEALALEHFDKMDANKDGQVTPEERRAGRPMIIKRVIEQSKPAG